MKLCFCVTSPETVNAFIRPQLDDLVAAGFEVQIVTGFGAVHPDVLEKASQVRQLKLAREIDPKNDLFALRTIWKVLRELKPEVVVASTPKISPLALFSARLLGVRVRIFQIRGIKWETLTGIRRSVVHFADKFAAWNATSLLAVSASVAREMQLTGATRSLATVLGLGGSKGVDLEIFKAKDFSKNAGDKIRIGFVGRLNLDKGIDIFPEIVAKLNNRDDVEIHIVAQPDAGNVVNPELLDFLRASKFINFFDERLDQGELANLMRTWDLLVFPSLREGLPNAVIEAGACGVPTIGWNVTGVQDVVIQGSTGWLVNPGSTEEFADEVVRIIDTGVYKNAGKLAHEFVAKNFDSKLVTQSFIGFIKEVSVKHGR